MTTETAVRACAKSTNGSPCVLNDQGGCIYGCRTTKSSAAPGSAGSVVVPIETAAPVPASWAPRVGDWAEWSDAGLRLVGRVRAVGQHVYCDDVSGGHLASWQAPRAEVQPWAPQLDEWCVGDDVDSGDPYRGRFEKYEEWEGRLGARIRLKDGYTVVVAHASLRPAARAAGSVEACNHGAADRGGKCIQCGALVCPSLAATPAPVTAPDPYAEHQRRLDEADKDPVVYERRREWYAREDLRAQVLQMWATLSAKRHPSDWEPPDDYEVCK